MFWVGYDNVTLKEKKKALGKSPYKTPGPSAGLLKDLTHF